jgi:hypothetical protein
MHYKDQLITSEAIYEDWNVKNMNVSIACIHYQKYLAAFNIAEVNVKATGRSEEQNC